MIEKEDAKYFDTMEDLFAHPGWKLLVEECLRMVYQLQADAIDGTTWEQVNVIRGRAQQLNEIIRMKEMFETIRAQKEEEKE